MTEGYMEILKNGYVECHNDYNEKLENIYEGFYKAYINFEFDEYKPVYFAGDSEETRLKTCIVKDIDFINYSEYSDYSIVLVKSDKRLNYNYDRNKRNYLWFKDDETMICFFAF